MDLEDVIALIRDAWPQRLERGRLTHVHRNGLRLPDGSRVHLRVLVQEIEATPALRCAQCADTIDENQAALSMMRRDNAEPACKDCVTAELTEAYLKGH